MVKIKSVATKHKKSYPQSLYNLTDFTTRYV